MVTKTGEGSDIFLFNPSGVTTERWKDEGGIDILALVNNDWLGDLQLQKTNKAIVVTLDGSTLTIPHDEDGLPSIEILEWRLPDDTGGTPMDVQYRLGIVTDPDGLSGPGQVFIGSKADDIVTAPKSGKKLPGGFTDIFGADGNDEITLSPSYETRAFGGEGNDTIRAMGAPDTTQYGNKGRDTLIGADGDDMLDGGRGRDILKGGAGKDTLYGDSTSFGLMPGQADRLSGGGGNDYIHGGAGRDIMRGGAGRDTFEWDIAHRGDGDVIKDFDAAKDQLWLDTQTVGGKLKARVESGDTIVSYGGIDMVRLEDVSLNLSQIDIDLL